MRRERLGEPKSNTSFDYCVNPAAVALQSNKLQWPRVTQLNTLLLLPLSRGAFVRFINCSITEQGRAGRKKRNFRVPFSLIYDFCYKSLSYIQNKSRLDST